MYCGKCGTNNNDYSQFCSQCGEKLHTAAEAQEPSAVVTDNNDKYRKIGIIGVAAAGVVALIIVIILFNLFGGRGYKATVNKLFDATFDADAEAILDLIPEEKVEAILDDEGYDEDEYDEFVEEGEEALKKSLDYIDDYLGNNWKATYNIEDVEIVKGGDLEDIRDEYDDEYDLKVSEARIAKVKITVKVKETEESNTVKIPLIKIGHSWYVDDFSIGHLF